jgi:hypothetical protein
MAGQIKLCPTYPGGSDLGRKTSDDASVVQNAALRAVHTCPKDEFSIILYNVTTMICLHWYPLS